MPRYFQPHEVEGLDRALVSMLDEVRALVDLPVVITSGKREFDTNAAVGGVQDSSHLRGLGVDIACAGSRYRFRLVSALLAVGFHRVGVYDKHCHADIDHTLPQDVIWLGKSS